MTLAQAKGLPNLVSHSLKAIPSLGLPLHHSCQVSPLKHKVDVKLHILFVHHFKRNAQLSEKHMIACGFHCFIRRIFYKLKES
ncbi:hypothetical protein HanIR_Chr10g0485491 [Helianthus annuus]|nr:hypothetical protein HanIR_Chr10g0485491 [Helianthus annuus]